MPTRRPHKKSRNGCDQCRQRRVKCDETRPKCSICLARGEPCDYTRQASWRARHSTRASASPSTDRSHSTGIQSGSPYPQTLDATHSSSSRAASEGPKEDVWRDNLRFRELELMHHWCTKTCDSYTSEGREICLDFVSKTAMQKGYLMEAILALTSLHIATIKVNDPDAHIYASEGYRYQNRAMAGLRNVLPTLSADNCDAIFLTSLMVMSCSMVSPLLPAGHDRQWTTTTEAIQNMAEVIKGLGRIMRLSKHWLIQGPLVVVFEGHAERSSKSKPVMPLSELRRLVEEKTTFEMRPAYEDAVDGLEEMLRSEDVLPWPVQLKPEFLDRLKAEEDLAIAIFMQWAVLLDRYDHMWWAAYSGKRLVEELSTTLDSRGGEWKGITAWCRSEVGLT